jgi:hypothetical protein
MINPHIESAFQRAIGQSPHFVNEAVEQLPIDERLVLLDVLRQRIGQTKREELVAEVDAVREEYRSENVKFGSVSDLMSELDEL